MGEAGKKFVSENYGWEKIACDFNRHIEEKKVK